MEHTKQVFLSLLVLRDFRNYECLELPLEKGISLFFGENAAGKTNLLEACYYISALTSLRAERDADLARWGKDGFYIGARGESPHATGLVKGETLLVPSPRRRLTLNNGPAKRHDLHAAMPCVYFSPDDLSLVKRGSSARRRYMDSLIARIDPRYSRDLSRYQDAVERRNACLKRLRWDSSWKRALDTVSDLLVETGSAVLAKRISLFEKLSALIKDTYTFIGAEDCAVAYLSSVGPVSDPDPAALAAQFRDSLTASMPSDRERCVTSVGPHRDDIEVSFKDRTFRYFGSQGQQRSLALALRMAEARMLEDSFGKKPVLLLDDVFSELDAGRREKVLSLCDYGHQILITSTDPVDSGRDFRMYSVGGGRVVRVGEGGGR